MSADDFGRLAPHLESVSLPRGFVCAEPDQPIENIYFIEEGMASIVTVSREGLEVEAGIFGREGVGPLNPAMGSDSTPNRIFIQLADDAWRMDTRSFVAALDASPTLRNLVMRYGHTLSIQMTYTALSNAVHSIDERLARWLLMCDDRIEGLEMALTHELMSMMLAVRRPSVTTSLHVLEGNGFIKAERGRIVIRDRHGLEDFAGDAYGAPEAEYRRLIGAMR